MEEKFTEIKYLREIEKLYKRFPSVQNVPFGDAYKPGLERMHAFDKALGNPSKQLKTVHIAGTNGKGSVANMLASAFTGIGLKTGLYTSPHILDFRERVRLSGRMVSKEYVYDFILRWKPVFEELSLSFFEITTGLALKYFADEGADVAVMEAGLGGRLDSTNIITPELGIVTSIGLDHCALLGDTLAKIAGEKAGIFKAGVPAVIGERLPETAPVFEAKAARIGTELIYAEEASPSLDSHSKRILGEMDLKGVCQEKNLRTVMVALDCLRGRFPELCNTAKVTDALIHTASLMDFHGRWERLQSEPDVICDIAHNAAALRYNFAQLQAMVSCGEYSSLIIVYGIMADKDLDAILPLMPKEASYIFCSPSTARALPADKILDSFSAYLATTGHDNSRLHTAICVEDAVKSALRLAAAQTPERDETAGDGSAGKGRVLVYIGGSTFTVAEALPLFENSTI